MGIQKKSLNRNSQSRTKAKTAANRTGKPKAAIRGAKEVSLRRGVGIELPAVQ